MSHENQWLEDAFPYWTYFVLFLDDIHEFSGYNAWNPKMIKKVWKVTAGAKSDEQMSNKHGHFPILKWPAKGRKLGGKKDTCLEIDGETSQLEGWFFKFQVSNEKRAPGCLGYVGDEILPSYIGILISHDIRIPINQPV